MTTERAIEAALELLATYGHARASSIAEALEMDDDEAARVLNALAGVGLVSKHGNTFALNDEEGVDLLECFQNFLMDHGIGWSTFLAAAAAYNCNYEKSVIEKMDPEYWIVKAFHWGPPHETNGYWIDINNKWNDQLGRRLNGEKED